MKSILKFHVPVTISINVFGRIHVAAQNIVAIFFLGRNKYILFLSVCYFSTFMGFPVPGGSNSRVTIRFLVSLSVNGRDWNYIFRRYFL